MITGLLVHLVIQQSGVIKGLAVFMSPKEYHVFQILTAVFGVVDMTEVTAKKWII